MRKPVTQRDRVAGEYPYYGATGILDYVADYIFDEPLVLIGEDGAKWGAGENTAFAAEGKIWVNNHAHVLRPHKSKLLDDWLIYYINYSDLGEFVSGLTVPKLNQGSLRSIPIPLPPVPEQQRIVGILYETFDGIATAKANAEKNLENARAMFESYLHSVFEHQGIDWERVTLEMLLFRGWIESHLDGNHGSDYPRKDEFISEGVPYISANCIEDERVDMSRAKHLSPERAVLLRKGIAKNNDVLFAHNATVGPVAILRTDEEKVILGTSLTYYRCNPEHILPEYLAHYMRSSEFKAQYLQVMRQSTRNQVPITKQREFFHVIPPLSEQKRITSMLDTLFDDGRRLENIYDRKTQELHALKKSLLHEAFSGNL
jgi:type I restriction enzyme S subunit